MARTAKGIAAGKALDTVLSRLGSTSQVTQPLLDVLMDLVDDNEALKTNIDTIKLTTQTTAAKLP